MNDVPVTPSRAPVAIFTYDRTGLVTVFEEGTLSAAGLDPDERPARALLARLLCPIEPEHVRRALAGEDLSVVGEVAGRLLEVHHFPLRHPCDGTVDLVIGVVFDVTNDAVRAARPTIARAEKEAARPGEALPPGGPSFEKEAARPSAGPEPGLASLALDPRHDPDAEPRRVELGSGGEVASARYDPAADLRGRPLFRDRLDLAIAVARRGCDRVGLLEIRLAGAEGEPRTLRDALVLRAGRRVRELLRESDTLARIDGATLGALLPGVDRAGALRVAEKIAVALAEPLPVLGRAAALAPIIGVAVFPDHGSGAGALLRSAADALERAALSSEPVACAAEEARGPLATLAELRDGIERGELVLHYQPVVGLRSGDAVAVEALARWEHPRRGLLLPSAFVPLVEGAGLVRPLAARVLATALGHCRSWRAMGHPISVAVNLSTRNLLDPHLPDLVAAALRAWNADAGWLRLEITESVVMSEPERAVGTLARLREMGTTLALDDVGAGYASLALARQLPIQQLKIDKSCVGRMARDRAAVATVRAAVELGHASGLEVVAEGVEDRDTWNALAAMGCDLAQGHYVSRPLPLDEIDRWLSQARPVSASA